MPITWLTRRILLDSIQLPFLLSSILFAIYSTKNYDDHKHSNKKANTTISKKVFLFILLSGVFLGLAIFTKIPAFTMIPLVGFLVLRNANNNKNKRLKILGLWLIPVFLLPLIWPIYAIYLNQYHEWTAGVLLQMNRTSQPLILSLGDFYEKDPILLIFGIAGLALAAIKRDLFILLWAIPLVTFLYFIGYVSLFYLIPLLPLFCIATAVLIEQATNKIDRIVNQKIASFVIASALVIFGLISTVILITTNVPSYQFEAEEFAIKYLTEKLDNYNYSNKVTILANPFYFWIPQYVFKVNDIYKGYEEKTPIETKKVLLIVDESFLNVMSRNIPYARVLQNLYNSTRILVSVNETVGRYPMNRYPYTNLNEYTNEKLIEIISIFMTFK